jgi:hypothetical protein
MTRSISLVGVVGMLLLGTATASGQIAFPKSGYYVGMGDSVAAGTGALPATHGYVYQLYDHDVFGKKQEIAFANASVRAARSWELRDDQVPQVLCTEPAQRPTVVTITAGANDVFRGDFDVLGIARRVAEAVNLLFNNPLLPTPVLDPWTTAPCPALENATILVSNYYSIPHPVPAVFAQLDALLQGFDQALRFWLAQIVVPTGSRLAIVDLYTPSLGRQGLVTIERRLGFTGPGPFDFDPHPTNVGHSFIAREFENVWRSLK